MRYFYIYFKLFNGNNFFIDLLTSIIYDINMLRNIDTYT